MSDFPKRITVKIAIAAGIILVLAGGITFFGNRIAAATGQIISARADLANWNTSLQSYVGIKSQYAGQAGTDITILNNVLPTEDQLIDLRKDFQFFAGSSNVTVDFSFTGERSTASPQIGALGISLNLTGDFNSLLQFIQKLKNFHYLISIDGVTFSEQENTMAASVRGEVFFRK